MAKMITPALERALQKNTGDGRLIKIEDIGSNDWDQEEESTAESGGFRSWFAPRIDFRVGKNSARFQGKEGYDVKGSMVDLFDGAVADLSGARLTGKKGKNKQDVWAEGDGGKLVLIPKDFDSVVVLRFEQIVVEPEHGVVGTSSTMVTLSHTDGQFKVEARGALIQGKQINLIDPVKKSGDRKTELTSVVLYEGKSEITEPIQEEPIRQEPIRQEPIREELIREELIREEPGEGVPIHIEPKAEEPPVAEDENIISEKEALAFSRERDIWSKDAGEDKALGFSKTFNAFTAPIVPGVAFSITLTPEASIGLSFHTGANEIRLDGDRKTATLTAGAALSGSLSLTLGAEVEAGLLFLISAYGGINATAGLSGSGDGNALAAAEISIPIVKEKGSIGIDRTKEITAEFNAGLNLTGAISADVGVKSALFAWEKSLYEYTFKTWNLAELSFSASMVRTYAPGMPLYKGWKAGDKNWTAQAFGKSFLEKYKAENHFGLLEKQHNRSVSFVGQAQRSYEEALVFLEHLKNPEKYIVAITKDEGEGTADSFLSRLLEVSEALNSSNHNSQIALEQLGNELRDCMASKSLKKALAFEAKRTEKHEERINELEAWNSSDAKKDFKIEFQKQFSLTSGYQDHVKLEAMKKVMTPETVKAYEQKRLEERKKKHTERIEKLKHFTAPDKDGKGKSDSEVREYYTTVLEAQRQKNHLSELANIEAILTYERERLAEVQKKHTERLKKLREKEAALEIQDESVVNSEFANYYFGDMDASAMRKVLTNYANPEEMLAYEDKRLKEKADKDRFSLLMKWREKLPKEDSFKAEDPKNFNRQEAELKNPKNRYKTKTIQDFVDYEEKRKWDLEEQSLFKKLRDTQMSQKEIDMLGEEKKVNANYKTWIAANTDAVKQALSLDTLIRYEEGRGRQESKGDTKHKDRIRDFKKKKAELKGIKEIERSNTEEKIVALALARKGGAESGLMSALKAGEFFDKSLLEKSELDKLNKVQTGYDARLEILKKFKGAGKNFYSAYIIYEAMVEDDLSLKKEIKEGKIGKEDFQTYAGQMAGDFDMAARLRYEEFCMSEKVTHGTAQKKMLKEQNTDSAPKKEDALLYADHLTRYDTLKSIYDEKELGEDEKYQKMLDAYKQMGGGGGFERELKAKGAQNITPKAIIKYEEDRKMEVGSKHQKRIDYLEKHGDLDYRQLLENYEEMARSDGIGILGAMKARLNTFFTVGKTGFEKSRDIETMTAAKILEYEEERSEEVSSKSRLRLNLMETNKSDEEKIDDYLNAGAGQGFYRMNKELIDAEKEKLNNLSDDKLYENVLEYEKERHDYYSKKYEASQNILNDIKQNQEKMALQIADTEKKIKELAAIRQDPKEILGRLQAINLGTTAQIMDNEKKITQESEAENLFKRGTDINQELQQMIVFMEDEEEGD